MRLPFRSPRRLPESAARSRPRPFPCSAYLSPSLLPKWRKTPCRVHFSSHAGQWNYPFATANSVEWRLAMGKQRQLDRDVFHGGSSSQEQYHCSCQYAQRRHRVHHNRPRPHGKGVTNPYLQRWLAETAEAFASSHRQSSPCVPTASRSPSPWRPHKFADAAVYTNKKAPKEKGGLILQRKSISNIRTPILRRERVSPLTKKGSPDKISSPKISSPIRRNYEKPPRHKTREDRYEPKMETKKSMGANKTHQKRRCRRKLTSGKEVVENFSTDALHQERLTVWCISDILVSTTGRC